LKKNFGISIEPSWPISYSLELAALAERRGFSNVWVPDSGPIPPYSDTIVTLSAIASATSRIRFGSAVLNFYTRNPAWIAASFLALADLGRPNNSKKVPRQRAILGIGVGSDWNVAKAGITARMARISQLREAIESISELFLGKEVTVRTDAFAIEGVTLSNSKPRIPIYVGTSSPKGLEMAGEMADGLILTNRIPEDTEESMKRVLWGLGNSTRRRKDLEIVNSVVVSVDPDRRKAMRAAKPTCAYLVAWLDDAKAEAHGIALDVKNKISRLLQEGDERSAAKFVDDRMVNLLTASGEPEDCVMKCKEYFARDVDQLALCEPFGPDPKESLDLLARKVIPRV
jgi:5,10-methylenetetrahydromethanopterin reductase